MSTKTITITHKVGDTWMRYGVAGIKTPDGALMDLTGWQIRSQARDPDTRRLVCDFDCQLLDPITQHYSHAATDTTGWPLSQIVCDVQFTSPSGFVISTPTFVIAVVEDETKPAA